MLQIKLNLGCGEDIQGGYINLDKRKYKGVDIVHDLDVFPYPFPDNYFDEIYSRSVLEHVLYFDKVIDELARISKNDAKWVFRMPFFNSHSYPHDPTHFRGCIKDSFDVWGQLSDHRYSENYFIKVDYIIEFPSKLGAFIPDFLRNFIALHIGGIIDRLEFYLTLTKEDKNGAGS